MHCVELNHLSSKELASHFLFYSCFKLDFNCWTCIVVTLHSHDVMEIFRSCLFYQKMKENVRHFRVPYQVYQTADHRLHSNWQKKALSRVSTCVIDYCSQQSNNNHLSFVLLSFEWEGVWIFYLRIINSRSSKKFWWTGLTSPQISTR